MKFAKWIVFIAFFALAENTPVIETSLDEHYKILSKLTYLVVNNYIGAKDTNVTHKEEFEGNVINAKAVITGGYVKHQFRLQDYFQFEMPLNARTCLNVSLDAYLRDFNHRFVTEVFPVDVDIIWNNSTLKVQFPDADTLNLKLLPNDYQYKPYEEEKIKKTIKSVIKNMLKKYINGGDYLKSLTATIQLSEVDNLDQLEPSSKKIRNYLGPYITTNYTLDNFYIYSLYEVQSISYNLSNLEASPQIVLDRVTGYINQKFHSKPDEPLELSFFADITMSINQKDSFNVNVQISKCHLRNTKTNSFLRDDESKLIVKDMESAIGASSIVTAWKKYTRETFERIPKPS